MSLRDARQKSVRRGTKHWWCHVPALFLDSDSFSSELISETSSIADLDIRDVDLDSAAVTAPAQVIEVSVQGSVDMPPAIDVGYAPTMDNVIPAPGAPVATLVATPAPYTERRGTASAIRCHAECQ